MRFGRNVFFFILFFLLALPTFAQKKKATVPAATQQWEYKFLDHCHEEDRRVDIWQLGRDGWELVGANNGVSTERMTTCQQYYFKRLKQSDDSISATPMGSVAAKCDLSIEKAPVIQGIRLGMKKEDLLNFFKKTDDSSPSPPRYSPPPPRQTYFYNLYPPTQPPNFSVQASATSYEGEITSYEVLYHFSGEWRWSHKEWLNKVTESLSLPANAWVEAGERIKRSKITCRDFSVEIGSGLSGNWGISVRSLSADAKFQEAINSYWQQRRREFKP